MISHWEKDIVKRSHKQCRDLPWMPKEEVVNEMRAACWRASLTHDPDKGSFEKYWWSVWLNRKVDLTRMHSRAKLREPVFYPLDLLEDPATAWLPHREDHQKNIIPPCPIRDPLTVELWNMLARGSTPADVQDELEISRRSYYAIIQKLRTPEVRRLFIRR